MSAVTTRSARTRRVAVAGLVLALAAGLTACGSGSTGLPGDNSDPKAAGSARCTPQHAAVAEHPLDPVVTNPKSQLPVTVTDAEGRKVTVTDTSRILPVNLYGSIAEIVFNLGLGDNVIGRDTSTTLDEAKDLPLVTRSGHDLSSEAVLALNPTVVLADDTIGPPEVLAAVRKAGVPVVMIDSEQTLPNVSGHIREIAAALGVKAAGEKLVDRVDGQIAAAKKSVPAGDKPKIAFLYLRGNAGIQLLGGKGAGSDAMIEAVGGIDAGTTLGFEGFRPLNNEALVKAAPDVILVMTDGLESVGGVDGLLTRPGVAQTPAGMDHRIIDMADGDLLNFGADTGLAVEALAKAVHTGCAASSTPAQ